MDLGPEHELERQVRSRLARLRPADDGLSPTSSGPTRVDGTDAGALGPAELFRAMASSRVLDIKARELRAEGRGFYTIGSAGHEANAALAAALRPTDPALLHYRSGGFFLARSMQVLGADAGLRRGIRDVLLGLVGAADDPIAGGRHKVFGRHDLSVIPQTSTIASHLPRALGVAMMIDRARKLGVDSAWPVDAVAVASFGDASANHSTATGAINAACQAAYQGLPVPLLLVCEDNGLGISVPTPPGWIEAAFRDRAGLTYVAADGADLAGCLATLADAVRHVRVRRRPVLVHLKVVRYLAHAGSDAEVAYRTPAQLAADLDLDPLVAAAAQLVSAGAADPEQMVAGWDAVRALVDEIADEVADERRLKAAEEIVEPLSPRSTIAVAREAAMVAASDARLATFGGALPEDGPPLTLAESINRSLTDQLVLRPEALVFGEDVGRKGGVYGLTRGLQRRFGAARVFDTLLDEQSILGLALGAGVSGLLPIPEIQYLAYLHNAEDQLRGEAASLAFFSAGQFRNPMVVRIAGLAYQKGFGGHFHNDDAVAVLRDIPGLVVACPARGDDAAAMLRTCAAAARVDGTVSVFLEPIALYHSRDLHEPGDGGWLTSYAEPTTWPDVHAPIGRARVHGDGTDLTIVTFGNGLPMSLRVARRLGGAGRGVRVLDLRWLAPLPVADILAAAAATGRVLVADETRRSGAVSEGVITALVDAGYDGRIARVTSADSYVPLGDAAELVLMSETDIERAAAQLLT
jgi:2-oxoisovalerate dehydrogenase E1 component